MRQFNFAGFFTYYKVRESNFITKCGRLLLQSTSGITKYERLLLQSASDITKCDSYYHERRNNLSKTKPNNGQQADVYRIFAKNAWLEKHLFKIFQSYSNFYFFSFLFYSYLFVDNTST